MKFSVECFSCLLVRLVASASPKNRKKINMPTPDSLSQAPKFLRDLYEAALLSVSDEKSKRECLAILGLIGVFEEDGSVSYAPEIGQ